MPTDRQMPVYQSHKRVWALKINRVNGNTITPDDDGYAAFDVDDAYISKHQPQAGGYYVVYEDGYKSFSPAQPFEEGYTLLEPLTKGHTLGSDY